MSWEYDGGPAFPNTNQPTPYPGMTLRDYIAIQSLNGFLSEDGGGDEYNTGDFPALAKWAYELADAMLEARKR